jgi:hypothetical protein
MNKELYKTEWVETFWQDTTKDKKIITVSISDILKFSKHVAVQELLVKNIKHLSLHKAKTDRSTLERVQKADLNYPIIVLNKTKDKIFLQKKKFNDILPSTPITILDGHHRLQKAINNKILTIKAKVIYLADMPKDWQWLFT